MKTKDIVITKKEIIKAIRKGELETGAYFDLQELPYIGNCNVCAVGAVFRHALKLPNNVGSALVITAGCGCAIFDRDGGPPLDELRQKYLNRGDWLTVLSDVFESNYSTEEERQSKTIEYVEENFPETVSINGSDLDRARDRAWNKLRNAAFFDRALNFKHPFPKRTTYSKYTTAEKETLTKEYGKFLKKRIKDGFLCERKNYIS